MEIINMPWLAEIYRLVEARLNSLESALERAKEQYGDGVKQTADGYEWNNHMSLLKKYSTTEVNAMKEFISLYDNGDLKCDNWESKISKAMWTQMALALYYGDIKGVYAGVTFIDIRDYIFEKMQ